MKPLTTEEMQELRSDIAHLGLPENKLDELIHLLDNIIVSIIDQNNGRHSVQLSLSARANYAFKNGNILEEIEYDTVESLEKTSEYAMISDDLNLNLEPE